jgi:hypothetical protein
MPSREVFWNIQYSYVMYILNAIAVAFLAFSIYRRTKLWRLGKPDDCSKNMGRRIGVFIRTMVVDVLAHRRFLRDPYAGVMHLVEVVEAAMKQSLRKEQYEYNRLCETST